MSNFKEEKKVVRSWLWFVIGLLILTIPIFTGLKYLGVIGSTVVERVVFKESFQYKEGMEQRANTLKANMAEIDMLIATGQGDVKKLNAQKSFLRVQLNAIQ